jgi:TRAP-type uncharacterized transport system fused permease subunit
MWVSGSVHLIINQFIMPPIMSVAAFVIADVLGITYAKVMIESLIPALLFYMYTAISVDFYLKRNGWISLEKTKNHLIELSCWKDQDSSYLWVYLLTPSYSGDLIQ